MVFIAKDFNDDMQEYLDRIYGRKRRYVETVSSSKSSQKESEVVPQDISEDEIYIESDSKKRGFLGWFYSLFKSSKNDDLDDLPPEVVEDVIEAEEHLEEIDEEVKELEDERESLLQRFLKLLRFSSRKKVVEEDFEVDVPPERLPDDVVDVIKRLHKWLEKLPNRDMRDFKTSEDFLKYKGLLEKYGLIKK